MESLMAPPESPNANLHGAFSFSHASHGSALYISTQRAVRQSLLDKMLTAEGASEPQVQALLDSLAALAEGAQKVLAATDAAT